MLAAATSCLAPLPNYTPCPSQNGVPRGRGRLGSGRPCSDRRHIDLRRIDRRRIDRRRIDRRRIGRRRIDRRRSADRDTGRPHNGHLAQDVQTSPDFERDNDLFNTLESTPMRRQDISFCNIHHQLRTISHAILMVDGRLSHSLTKFVHDR